MFEVEEVTSGYVTSLSWTGVTLLSTGDTLLNLFNLSPQVERDEKYSLENEKELAKLRYENKHLKRCLGFGKKFGSLP